MSMAIAWHFTFMVTMSCSFSFESSLLPFCLLRLPCIAPLQWDILH
uniref:Uncharacterized protein n=1 Tax=Arundo donax TaxID=35708 RepID=A0A0A9HGF3_ARUDO